MQASLCAAICEHSDRILAEDLTLTEQRQRESRVRVLSGSVSHGEGESCRTAYLRGTALPRGKSSLHVTHGTVADHTALKPSGQSLKSHGTLHYGCLFLFSCPSGICPMEENVLCLFHSCWKLNMAVMSLMSAVGGESLLITTTTGV